MTNQESCKAMLFKQICKATMRYSTTLDSFNELKWETINDIENSYHISIKI